jgi:hypothetical protein
MTQVNEKKGAPAKFPLRLMPSVRKSAEEVSRREGVSMNQFINLAVAEKLAHLQHEDWLSRRMKPEAANLSHTLAILDRPTDQEQLPGDELPQGYVSISKSPVYAKSMRAK